MTDNQRLQALIDQFASGSRPRFAAMLALPQATIATWLFRGSITAKGRERILDTFPTVSREWLTRGTGTMLPSAPDTLSMPRENAIPFFGELDATCGAVEQPFVPEYATDTVYLPGVHGTAVLPAEGDSMLPTIQDGDKVVVGSEVRLSEVRQGIIYLICTREGHRMFKRIEQTSPSSRHIMAVSDNAEYTPRAVVIDKRDILHIYPAVSIIRGL